MYYDEAMAALGSTIDMDGQLFKMVAVITNPSIDIQTGKLRITYCNPIVVPTIREPEPPMPMAG